MQTSNDNWAEGSSYDAFMGRWSQMAAAAFLRWLDPQPGLRWLDVGCGTGAMSRALIQSADPEIVTACDPSAPFIDYARAHNHSPQLAFQVATIDDLPQVSGGYGAVVSGLVLNFIADPVEAVRSMMRRTSQGGVIAAYVWDYSGRMDFLRTFWDVAVALDPAAQSLDEGARFPLCHPDRLESTFREAGLSHVRTEAIDIPTVFTDFAEYWQPFLAGIGPAPKYVASLPISQRDELASALKRRLDPADGAPIQMIARAWAVRGELA